MTSRHRTKRPQNNSSLYNKWYFWTAVVTAVLGGVFGVVYLIVPTLIKKPDGPTPPVAAMPEVKFQSIEDSEQIMGGLDSAHGTHARVPDGHEIWLVARRGSTCYPMDGPAIKEGVGNWKHGPLEFFESGQYQLTTVLADQQASAVLRAAVGHREGLPCSTIPEPLETISVNVTSAPIVITEAPKPEQSILKVGQSTKVTVKATCGPECELTYAWRADYGTTPTGRTDQSTITYTAPTDPKTDRVYVTIYDNWGNSVESQSSQITIIGESPTPVPSPTATPETCTPQTPYGVCIYEPRPGPWTCPGDNACMVNVTGRFEGPENRSDVTVIVLVSPVNPPSEGWWIQGNLQFDRIEGTWGAQATLGAKEQPPVTGNKFSIYALLVDEDVAKDINYAPGTVLKDFTVIPYHAVSTRINLDIQSP